MLRLRRKQGEAVMIGDDVEVRVSAITKGQVHLDVYAPLDVRVDRKEVRLGTATVSPKHGKRGDRDA